MASGPRHAFVWQNGKMRDLGTFGGRQSQASAINERGQIVGAANTTKKDENGNQIWHAFLWERGRLIDLGVLPGRNESGAGSINERGQIIGSSETKSGARHAVLWTLKRGYRRRTPTIMRVSGYPAVSARLHWASA
jgi:probable HAF family extracellular repeat protein